MNVRVRKRSAGDREAKIAARKAAAGKHAPAFIERHIPVYEMLDEGIKYNDKPFMGTVTRPSLPSRIIEEPAIAVSASQAAWPDALRIGSGGGWQHGTLKKEAN